MSEWQELTLGKITEPVKNTYLPKSEEQLAYIGLEHIEQETLRLTGVGTSSDVTSNKFKFESNDVLFGKLRPYFRKVYKPKFPGICSTDIWVFRAKKGFVQDFLFYFLASWDFVDTANSGEGGTRMPRADWNFLKTTNWLVPCEEEQKAIASVLSSLDDKIDLLHRQNTTLERMAETLFRQWFVEEAQENWEERPLSSIANFLNGLACQKFPPTDAINKLPVLKIKELSSGISENSDWATTNVKPEYIVENGDVIFAWSASLMVKVWDGEKCVLNQHLFKVTSLQFPKWFYLHWCKYHLDEFISISSSHATTMGHIKRGDLDMAMVKVPKPEELALMAEQMTPLLEKQIINAKQIKTLKKLRDNLLPKLMSGEVRVI
ncbi:MAG: restriction endonuclease subunit S [Methylotenera sp.]|nr:restriction endonuclease subunit S [Methylotenera sp.]